MKPSDRRVVAAFIGAVVGFMAMRKAWGALIGAVLGIIVDAKLGAAARARPRDTADHAPPPGMRGSTVPDHRTDHDVLGIAHDADLDAVKARFRDLAKKYHPDHFQNASPQFKDAAESEFKRIRDAYERILDRAGATP
jgi:DnaJ-domain-containing protein 1